MTLRDVSKVVKYWLESAEHDLEMARALFHTGKYDYCLFLCHLSLEKLLKAMVTRAIKDHPPYTHNLLYLAAKTNLQLSKAQIELLDQINKFNMEARYPEDLQAFYKKVDKIYSRKYLEATKEIWKWFRKKSEM
ncbi:MAG: HEPN domain-containing protein [Deltaproteobacteria bacterium]|nr:HEPN domain-containing protein [Deltaproteobacteria bacterium]